MKKRLLSMILALSMMLTILPVNAITALAANNSCGANLTYELTQNTDDPGTYTLTIRGEGAMYNYSSSTVPWDAQKSKITSVVIGGGVTSIGNNAFKDCSALKSVSGMKDVTSLGSGAFDGCESLGKDSGGTIAIPVNVTAIGPKAFRGCSALTSLALPETVNSIGNTAFQGCSNLETINIPSGVKLIEKDTFHGCEKLKDVTIPAGVTSIGNSAFKACKTFRNIEIPKGVTKIDYFAFEDCTQLETVGIPSTATNIRNFAFRNCPKLKSFVFPSGTTQIQPGVLSGCKNLESVTIPEEVTKIWGSAFYGCSLNSVKLPSTLQTICKLAFYGCDQLSEITIPESVKLIEQSAFESSTELKSVMLAKGSVPKIEENAFSKSLGTKTKIYYPDYKAGWFAQNAAEKITDLKTDGVTISAGGKSMDVDICYLCDVTFNANGGMLASGAPAKTQVYRTEMVTNTKANNLRTVDDPSKQEYTFIGWYTSPTPQEGEAAFSLADTPVDPQTEDGNLTLYAVYTTVTISGPTDNTVKAGEGSDVFTVAADKGTGAAKAKFDFAGGKVQYRTGDTEEWLDLTSNELNIDDLTGKQFRVVPDADAATAQKTLTVKLMDASGNDIDIAGATASTTFAVTARKPAEVTITGLDNTTVKAGEAKDFTVSVTPNDDANTGAKATITVSGANAVAVEKIQYKDGGTWKDVPDEGLSIDAINNTEFKLITKADANDGAVTITVTAKKANGPEIDKKVAAVTVTKKEEPVTPGGGSTGGGENPGENPGSGSTGGSGNTGDKDPETKSYELTVIGGSFTAKQGENALDVETAGENNTLTAKIPAGAVVTVTLNKAAVPEGMNFDQWRINDDTLMGNPDVAYNQESFHFTMPDHDVKVEVMYKDATIESDGPGILGTGALIATGVVGSAALLYQGHMLGTELYLRYLLPHGAVIPQNRAELALLVWNHAGKPAPAAVLPADATDTQKAVAWAVENDLLKAAKDNGETYVDTDSVSRVEVIRVWNKAQEK